MGERRADVLLEGAGGHQVENFVVMGRLVHNSSNYTYYNAADSRCSRSVPDLCGYAGSGTKLLFGPCPAEEARAIMDNCPPNIFGSGNSEELCNPENGFSGF